MAKKISLIISLMIVFGFEICHAAYPGLCHVVIKRTTATGLSGSYVPHTFSVNETTGLVAQTSGAVTTGSYVQVIVSIYYVNTQGGAYIYQHGLSGNVSVEDYPSLIGNDAGTQSTYQAWLASNNCTASQCLAKSGQLAAPIYVGLPYHAAYYDTAGLCVDSCQAKPQSGVTLDSYASDGSGYAVGPWSFTGAGCTAGVTPNPPAQPDPEDQCSAQRNVCEAQCVGRAYAFNCTDGSCDCFGAPGYTTDPPKNPITPTADPGSPNVPSSQTAATDPGVGGNQLGAQISNQAKQLAQGDSQLGQLGGINAKLGAVISNQAKQLGQGDTIIDYERRSLGVQEEIRNKLNEITNEEIPELPGDLELDGTIPDTKNWAEYNDAAAIGLTRAQKQIDEIEEAQIESPFNLTINTQGAVPYLSGPMFGRIIEIRFDRPWMQTGYSIMNAMLIGIGYLQGFLMVNRTFTGA